MIFCLSFAFDLSLSLVFVYLVEFDTSTEHGRYFFGNLTLLCSAAFSKMWLASMTRSLAMSQGIDSGKILWNSENVVKIIIRGVSHTHERKQTRIEEVDMFALTHTHVHTSTHTHTKSRIYHTYIYHTYTHNILFRLVNNCIKQNITSTWCFC